MTNKGNNQSSGRPPTSTGSAAPYPPNQANSSSSAPYYPLNQDYPPTSTSSAPYPQPGSLSSQGYPPQNQGYPPPQNQGHPPSQSQGYPPKQNQGYPPQGYPTSQTQGYPPLQTQGYPPSQTYSPQTSSNTGFFPNQGYPPSYASSQSATSPSSSAQQGATKGQPFWLPAKNSDSYETAFVGGHEADGTPLYVARGHYCGSLIIGKAAPHLNGCHVPYGGGEQHLEEFELLYFK